MNFDLVIRNGVIIDGTGKHRYRSDIGITDGKIVEISENIGTADKTIDAGDLIIAPGVIDIHGHSDITVHKNPSFESKIHQGITTEVWGNCGLSLAPLPKSDEPNTQLILHSVVGIEIQDNKVNWTSFKEYLTNLPDLGINIVPLVGHATLRAYVMGMKDAAPTKKEMIQMEQLIEDCLKNGAFGMSVGLEYSPDYYSTPGELIHMCKILVKYNAFYAIHIRNEDIDQFVSIEEALEISKKSGCPVHISHLKLAGENNRGQSKELLIYLEDAKKQGIKVTWDAYPYNAWGTDLISYLPRWVGADGYKTLAKRLRDNELRERIKKEINQDVENRKHPLCAAGWDKVVISRAGSTRHMEGKDIAAIAKESGADILDVVLDILADNSGVVTILVHCMDIEDVKLILQHKDTIIATDSRAITYEGSLSKGCPHPRYCGSIPRILRYAREGLFSFEEAIRKMTSLPADRIGLMNRGRIEVGMFADLMIFNPKTVRDNATYTNPVQRPTGIDYVIVNGHLVINKGVHTGALKGKMLKPN